MVRRVSRSARLKGRTSGPASRLTAPIPEARSAPFPGFIAPALATLVAKPPGTSEWLHEIKFDGYRFQLHLEKGQVRFFTRRGYDWSGRVRVLRDAAARLAADTAILDGEVVVPAPDGRSDFHALEKELKARDGASTRLAFFAFDLLYLDGFDLRRAPLIERKTALESLLAKARGPIRYSEHLDQDGREVWAMACKLALEGIVSKRRDSPYASGRTDHWRKLTCRHRDTFVAVGWAERAGRFDGVYLGRPEGGRLRYAGKLERGFIEEDKRRLLARFQELKLTSRKVPIAAVRSFPKARWVEPKVLLEAEFRGMTGDGLLRHPSFKGIREDLKPSDLG